ncbi:hypothetical protein ACWENA_00635 [Streptomyces sp. NPDC004779]|uniref:hypothetical protein n=1 Tax=Streptomyces sp. NPDC004435 TaxID=3364701 RepID=UPI0036A9AF9D
MTAATAVPVTAALVLTGCTLAGPAPRQVDFGFRLDATGNVVVAYPLCAAHEVAGASVYVEATGSGADGDGFTTLWSGRDPATEEAKRGVFVIGTDADFREHEAVKSPLPDGYYVAVTERSGGQEQDGQDHWVTPSRLKGRSLGLDEYLTDKGKTLTRDQINAQAVCAK